MIIRIAQPTEYDKVRELYQACNYNGGIHDNDVVVIAEDGDELIGAVRLCPEHGIKVLRGMQIKSAYCRRGTGTLMLKFMQENVDMTDCYCLPYTHLKIFYGQIGFGEISPAEAPDFLAERLEDYLERGLEVLVMKMRNSK